MLTMSGSSTSGAALDYFKHDLTNPTASHYAASEGHAPQAEPLGTLARRLGLPDRLDMGEFGRLLDGNHPVDGRRLIQRIKRNRRAAWQFVLNAPKGFSAAALLGGDPRLIEAHRTTSSEVVAIMEGFAFAHRGDGNLKTDNLAVVRFTHDSARPVNGFVTPHLHDHLLVLNMTSDPEGVLFSVETGPMFAAVKYVGAWYRSRLAERVRSLGYAIERRSDGLWDLAGFTDAYLAELSPRRSQILEMSALFEGTASARDIAALATRQSKESADKSVTTDTLRRLNERYGNQAVRVVEAARFLGKPVQPEDPFDLSRIANALDSVFHSAPAVPADVAAEIVMTASGNMVSPDDVRKVMETSGTIVLVPSETSPTGRPLLVDRRQIEAEARMLKTVWAGIGTFPQLFRAESEDAALRETERRLKLNDGQSMALREIVMSRDRILAVQGSAGTGKSELLRVIAAAAERDAWRIIGLAPLAPACDRLREKTGLRVETLQKHVRRKNRSMIPTLYVLDEAGLAGTEDMDRFLSGLNPSDRVILLGDDRQHRPVPSGAPFSLFLRRGIPTVFLSEVIRQTNSEVKEVVRLFERGNHREGFEALKRLTYANGAHGLIEIKDDPVRGATVRLEAVADDFAADPDSALAVVPDNRTRNELNALIRARLIKAGRLGKSAEIEVLVPRRNVSRVGLTDPSVYAPGDRVIVRQGFGDFTSGECTVVDCVWPDRGVVSLIRESGENVRVELAELDTRKVDLFAAEPRSVAVGDRIIFTGDSRRIGAVNGEIAVVVDIEAQKIELRFEDGRTVPAEPADLRHIDHGYVLTSYKAQGDTRRRVLVHFDPKRGGMTSEGLYVAASRVGSRDGTEELRLYVSVAEQVVGKLDQTRRLPDTAVEALETARSCGWRSPEVEAILPTFTPGRELSWRDPAEDVAGRFRMIEIAEKMLDSDLRELPERRDLLRFLTGDSGMRREWNEVDIDAFQRVAARISEERDEFNPIREELAEGYGRLHKALETERDHLARLLDNTVVPLDSPPRADEDLITALETAVFRSGNIELIRLVGELRTKAALAAGRPEYGDAAAGRLVAVARIMRLRAVSSAHRKADFDARGHLLPIKMLGGESEMSLAAIEAELNRLRFNELEKPRRDALLKRLPEVRSELRKRGSKLDAEHSALTAAAAEAEGLTTRLGRSVKPVWTAEELIEIETFAMRNSDSEMIFEYEDEILKRFQEQGLGFRGKELLIGLAARAAARTRIAEADAYDSGVRLSDFHKRRPFIRVPILLSDGTMTTVCEAQLKPKSFVEGVQRGVSDVLFSTQPGTVAVSIGTRRNKADQTVGRAVGIGLRAVRGIGVPRPVQPVYAWAIRTATESRELRDIRRIVEAGLHRQERELTESLKQKQTFARAVGEIYEGYRNAFRSNHVPPPDAEDGFLPGEANRLERGALRRGAVKGARSASEAAVLAGRRREKEGNSHPLTLWKPERADCRETEIIFPKDSATEAPLIDPVESDLPFAVGPPEEPEHVRDSAFPFDIEPPDFHDTFPEVVVAEHVSAPDDLPTRECVSPHMLESGPSLVNLRPSTTAPAPPRPSPSDWKTEKSEMLRAFPVEDVVKILGGTPVKNGRSRTSNKYLLPDGRKILVANSKAGEVDHGLFNCFTDSALRGKGAFDLLVKLGVRPVGNPMGIRDHRKTQFTDAMNWMLETFGPQTPVVSAWVGHTVVQKPTYATPSPALARSDAPARKLDMPPVDDDAWKIVRAYLIRRRKLSEEVVDFSHKSGRLYAARRASSTGRMEFVEAVFVMGDDPTNPTGGQIRRVLGIANGHRVILDDDPFFADARKLSAPGTRKNDGPFWSLPPGKAEIDRWIVVESAIDALSVRQMMGSRGDRTAILAYGGLDTFSPSLVQRAKDRNISVIVAYDNDQAGQKAAAGLSEKLAAAGLPVERIFPSSKDWNDDLSRGIMSLFADRLATKHIEASIMYDL